MDRREEVIKPQKTRYVIFECSHNTLKLLKKKLNNEPNSLLNFFFFQINALLFADEQVELESSRLLASARSANNVSLK